MTVARLLAAAVGAVVAFAGANKVTGRAQWRAAYAAQSVPRAVGEAVPFIELLLGVCLVVLPLNPLVLGATTFLLVVFTVFLTGQIIGKSTVPCACFGARSTRPPSWPDVVRNLVFIAALSAAAVLA